MPLSPHWSAPGYGRLFDTGPRDQSRARGGQFEPFLPQDDLGAGQEAVVSADPGEEETEQDHDSPEPEEKPLARGIAGEPGARPRFADSEENDDCSPEKQADRDTTSARSDGDLFGSST
jgi:hypothetical protein